VPEHQPDAGVLLGVDEVDALAGVEVQSGEA